MEDYYALLEVAPDADAATIKKQYSLMLQAWHPDKFRTEDHKRAAGEKAKAFNEAFRILSDATRRASYDRMRAAAARGGAGSADAAPPRTSASDVRELPRIILSPLPIPPLEVTADGQLEFSIEVRHAGGPPYDPSRHDLQIDFGPPWNRAEVRVDPEGNSLPLTLHVEIDLKPASLNPDSTYEGAIDINVVEKTAS